MHTLYKHIAIFVSFLGFAACQGTIDPEAEGGLSGDQTDSTLTVPEGVLRIFADKTEIVADGMDEVTFKVMFGSKDVSSEKTLQLTRSYEGSDPKYMAYGAHAFSTSTAGKYTFKAEYYYAGKKYSDNEVEVVAKPYFTGDAKAYAQKALAVYFTSTSCTSCPSAFAGLKTLQQENPGKISVVAFHKYLAMPDPMEIDETEEFRNLLGGFTGLPRVFWNMRMTENALIGPDFHESYQQELAAYEPSCGLALKTEYDAAASELEIELGVTSNLPVAYRYIIFLVEDGIDEHPQNGSYYVHDNVVRDVLTPATGTKMNDNLPFTVGVEVSVKSTAVISNDWNVDNMRVVAAALRSDDGGSSYVVNNINECKLGASVDYIYAE